MKVTEKVIAFTKWVAKVPEATYNCPTVRWNDGTSWPVKSGHGCIACASHRFWDTKSPFYKRLPSVPGFGVDIDAGKVGLWLTGGVAAALGLHGIASAARAQMRPRGNSRGAARPRSRGKMAWWSAKGRRKNHDGTRSRVW